MTEHMEIGKRFVADNGEFWTLVRVDPDDRTSPFAFQRDGTSSPIRFTRDLKPIIPLPYCQRLELAPVKGTPKSAAPTPEQIAAVFDRKPTPPDNNPKTIHGIAKPSMFGIPRTALLHLGRAMADGVVKYGLFNWREKTVSTSVYIDAHDRHVAAYIDGEDIDPKSGVHHLAHAMACLSIILDAMEQGTLNDDRGPKGKAAELIAAWTKDVP